MKNTIRYAILLLFMIPVALRVSAQQKEIRIISYNILKGMETDTTEGKQVFTEWVRQQNPDILAIQEANYFDQKKLETLAHGYGHPYAIQLRDATERGYPPAITSRTPIVNVDRVLDNMWHGFIRCKVGDLNIIVLHFSPHVYQKRQEEVQVILETVRQSGPFEKWLIMGDFNSVSPLDKDLGLYGEKYLERLRNAETRNPNQSHLHNGEVDFSVQQSILDFGFVDAARQDPRFRDINPGSQRIDFIYVSPDLRDSIVRCGFIWDDFTRKYSDHRPVELILKVR